MFLQTSSFSPYIYALVSLVHLTVWGPVQGKLELYCSVVIQMHPPQPLASSISSLFSELMLQWSSSALSSVTPKQLLDSFTFIVTCQALWV